jgi:Protein of unknown function (DUF3892)
LIYAVLDRIRPSLRRPWLYCGQGVIFILKGEIAMSKWADYIISAVRFNAAGTHIRLVRTHVDDGGKNLNPATANESREFVIANLAEGRSYVTTVLNVNDSEWICGAAVHIVTINGEKFIKTTADKSKTDNLDNLPTF